MKRLEVFWNRDAVTDTPIAEVFWNRDAVTDTPIAEVFWVVTDEEGRNTGET